MKKFFFKLLYEEDGFGITEVGLFIWHLQVAFIAFISEAGSFLRSKMT